MKIFYLFLQIFVVSLCILSCSKKNQVNKLEASDAKEVVQSEVGKKLIVDINNSTINWHGFKPGGSHHGTLGIKSGELFIEDKQLKSGNFILDMNKIICLDLSEQEGNSKLIQHLKSADFFDTEKFPEGKFSITQTEALTEKENTIRISGNLELKGVSKNITFEANVKRENNQYIAISDTFNINRTQWGVNYGSKNIFKNLKDSFIEDDIEISIVITAKEEE